MSWCGGDVYADKCDGVATKGYDGFRISQPIQFAHAAESGLGSPRART